MNHFATISESAGSLLAGTTAAAIDFQNLWQSLLNSVKANPLLWLYIVAAVIIIIWYLLWSNSRSRRDFRVYQDEGGVAVVSPKALRHLIFIACEDVGTASSPKIRFRQSRDRINIEIGIKLYQSQRLSQIHELLRQRIRQTCEENHGILVGDVSLKVLGFKKDPDHHGDDEGYNAHPQQQITSAAPGLAGEASAASLYEEPVEEAIESDDTETQVDQEPRKRRFGLFGRHKDGPEAELVPDDAPQSDATGGNDTGDATGGNADSDDKKNA